MHDTEHNSDVDQASAEVDAAYRAHSRPQNEPPGQMDAARQRPPLSGTDVISFAESINPRFAADIFGDQRSNSMRRLVISAIENFAAKGYHGTTTRDIARGADMSPAALYVHFPSKKDLLFKLTRAMASAMIEDLARARGMTDDPRQQLHAFVASYVHCNARMHTAVHVATLEYQVLDPEQHAIIEDIRLQVNRIFDECLTTGRALGYFTFSDTTVMRTAILALCVSVSSWFSADGPRTAEEIAEEYGRLVLNMAGAIPASEAAEARRGANRVGRGIGNRRRLSTL